MPSLNENRLWHFEIRLLRASADKYLVIARAPTGEQISAETHLPDLKRLTTMLAPTAQTHELSREITFDEVDVLVSPQAAPKRTMIHDIGEMLTDSLFPGRIGELFHSTRARAREQKMYLRVLVHLQDSDLINIPWEWVRVEGNFLSTSPGISLAYSVDSTIPVSELVTYGAGMKVLVVSPAYLDRSIDPDHQELSAIEAAVRDAGGIFTLCEGPDLDTIYQVIRSSECQIIHFITHGAIDENGNGVLAFPNGSTSEVIKVDGDQLATVLQGTSVKVVVLNACDSAFGAPPRGNGMGATLVRRGIPGVVAMRYRVKDSAAIRFSRSFYECLIETQSLDRAVIDGRKALIRATSAEEAAHWASPVLFARCPGDQVMGARDERIVISSYDFESAGSGRLAARAYAVTVEGFQLALDGVLRQRAILSRTFGSDMAAETAISDAQELAKNGHYQEALEKIGRASRLMASLYQESEEHKQRRSVDLIMIYAVFSYAIVLAVVVAAGHQFFNLNSNTIVPILGIPLGIMFWSAVGSLASLLKRFNSSRYADIKYAVKWFFTRPLQGCLMGIAVYLLMQAGLAAVGRDARISETEVGVPDSRGSGGSEPGMWLFWALAFYGGFSDRFSESVFKLASDRLMTRSPEGGAPSNQEIA